jgi:glycine cleavage system H protein
MSQTPGDRRYTTDHEWIKIDGDIGIVGITDFAQSELGDVTYVEVPQVGKTIEQGETFGVVESVKAVSDIYAPLGGEIVEVNEALANAPELINESPYEGAWMIKIRLTDPAAAAALLDAAAYEQHAASSGH